MNEFMSWLIDTGYEKVYYFGEYQIWENSQKQKIVVLHEKEGLKSMLNSLDYDKREDLLSHVSKILRVEIPDLVLIPVHVHVS